MFKKKGYKKVVISILALTMIFGTVALAAEGIVNKQVTATYGRIKFNYEGSDVTSQIESKYDTPAFTVDGRAYAPVRAMADLLGVDIDYDDETHTVKITDNIVEEYEKRLDEKDREIEEFKEEIKKLKEVAKEEVVDKEDLKSLEKDLNKKYDEYERIEFSIFLKENKDDITININTDLSSTKDEQIWIRMKYTDKKYLIENIVDAVRKEFKNADITGTLYDSSSRKDLYTFKQTKSGSLSISNKDYGDNKYNDDSRRADRYVEDEFYREGIDGARLSGTGHGGWNDYFKITFPYSRSNEDAWDDLIYNSRDIEALLNDIAGEIEYEYNYDKDEYVEIDIYMGSDRVGTYDKYGKFRER